MTQRKSVYLHTIRGLPATFSCGQICLARKHGAANSTAISLAQIKTEQREHRKLMQRLGIISNWSECGHLRYELVPKPKEQETDNE